MPTGRATFLLALIAVTLVFCGFLAGVIDVLDLDGALQVLWQVLFALGAIALFATTVFSIVRLVRRQHAVASVATLMVPIVPLGLLGLLFVG